MKNLLTDFLTDTAHALPGWEALIVALGLALAWLAQSALTRLVTPGSAGAWRLGLGGINRILFPLVAVLVILLGKAILLRWLPGQASFIRLVIPLLLSLALVRLCVYILRHVFSPGGWLKTWERVIAGLIWLGVALHITGLLPEIHSALDELSFSVGKQHVSLLMVLEVLFTLAASLMIALWLGREADQRIMGNEKLDMNLRVLLSKVLRALLVLVGVIIALSTVGIDLTLFSVFGGALGVGLGFGLQKIASNYVSGFIILLDRSIRIGDVVTVDKHYGTVTNITGRFLVVRGQDGSEAIIPNETLITGTTINHSFSAHDVREVLPLQISYQSDLEAALRIIGEAGQAHPRVLPDPPARCFIKSFGDNGIDLELAVWIRDPEDGLRNLRSELYLAVWQAFQREGIEIPYPQREVRILNDDADNEITILGEQKIFAENA